MHARIGQVPGKASLLARFLAGFDCLVQRACFDHRIQPIFLADSKYFHHHQ